MKLRKLTIHNIASIADASIYFDGKQLQNEAVFLICGETGSGKTSILDAICLALYNSTPRLSMVSGKDSYTDVNGEQITLVNPNQYLRKGTWEASVTLDFEAGGKEWRASWSTHRANKKVDGRFQGINWELMDLESGLCSKGSEAAKVTGLSFDEFRRTTMLAQGDFTAFLKSKDDEKSAILEKITGSGIYRQIGKRISDRFKETNSDHAVILERVRTLKDSILDEATIAKYKEEIVRLQEDIGIKEAERKSLLSILAAFEENEKLKNEIASHEARLEEARKEYSRLSGGLEFARRTLAERESQLSRHQSYIDSSSIHADMYADSGVIIENLKGIITDESRLEGLKRDLGCLSATHKLKKEELESCQIEESRIEKACNEQEEKVRILAQRRSELNPDLIRRQKEDIDTISRLTGDAEKIATELRSAEELMATELTGLTSCRKEAETAESAYIETSALYEKLKECNEQWAKDARASLTVGGDCPVCGQKIATREYLESISDEHFESLLKPVKENLAEKAAILDKAKKDLIEKETGTRLLEERIRTDRRNLEEAVRSVRKAQDEAGSPDCSAERYQSLCSKLEEAERISKELEENTSILNEMSKEYIRLKSASSNARLAEQEISGKILSNSNLRIETENHHKACLALVRSRITWKNWEDEWNSDRTAFLERLAREASSYRDAVSHLDGLKQNVLNIRNGLNSILHEYQDTLAVMPALESLPVGTIARVDRLEACWSTLRSAIIAADKGLKEAAQHISEVNKVIEGRNKEKIAEETASVTEMINISNQTIGSHSKTLKDNEEAIRKHDKELADLEKSVIERDQWKALNDVFGKKDGEYFQKIAQGFIMNDILNRANHYLKDITGRYVLEAQKGSLNIIVRDMEQGGIPRSTSTISGGESFILSLALALGLSSLGKGRISNDILFIDEGFGSLSEEYLNTVIETLQRLNEKSGKRVGIISHVEQLRNRIAVKIAVSKINQTTSKVDIISGNAN